MKRKDASVATRDIWFPAKRDAVACQAPLKEEQRHLRDVLRRGLMVRRGNIDFGEVFGKPIHHLTVLILDRFHRKIGPLVGIRFVVV